MIAQFLSRGKVTTASIADIRGGVITFMLLDDVLSMSKSQQAPGKRGF
jgi:hypothetical protein